MTTTQRPDSPGCKSSAETAKKAKALFREAKHSATRVSEPGARASVGADVFDPLLSGEPILGDEPILNCEPKVLDGEISASSAVPATSVFLKPAMDMEKLALGVRLILEAVGEDVHREGLEDTPSRVARMYRELLYGMNLDAADEVTCEFTEGSEDPVIVKDIPFATICEHHLVPFIGKAHVAYIPKDGRITGLSKIARVVELTARRLQVQERMTSQIAEAMMKALRPQGVLVILEAEHLCMSIRGVRKPGTMTTTMSARGTLKEDRLQRQEIMTLIDRN